AGAVCGGAREPVRAEAATQLTAETGGKVETHPCDVRDAAAVEAMLEKIWATRPLDGLVNNAAGNFIARTEELSPRAIDAVLNIVLPGSAYCTVGSGRPWPP